MTRELHVFNFTFWGGVGGGGGGVDLSSFALIITRTSWYLSALLFHGQDLCSGYLKAQNC